MKTKRDIFMYLGATIIKIKFNRWNSSPIRIKVHRFPHPPNSKHALNKLGRNGKESLTRLGDMKISLSGIWVLAGSQERSL